MRAVTIKRDATPPTLACAASPAMLWPPNHKLVPIATTVDVTDALSGPNEFRLSATTTSEGIAANDIQDWTVGEPDISGLLRAERNGSGRGRVYTLTYFASDLAGNSATCDAHVTVRLTRADLHPPHPRKSKRVGDAPSDKTKNLGVRGEASPRRTPQRHSLDLLATRTGRLSGRDGEGEGLVRQDDSTNASYDLVRCAAPRRAASRVERPACDYEGSPTTGTKGKRVLSRALVPCRLALSRRLACPPVDARGRADVPLTYPRAVSIQRGHAFSTGFQKAGSRLGPSRVKAAILAVSCGDVQPRPISRPERQQRRAASSGLGVALFSSQA